MIKKDTDTQLQPVTSSLLLLGEVVAKTHAEVLSAKQGEALQKLIEDGSYVAVVVELPSSTFTTAPSISWGRSWRR